MPRRSRAARTGLRSIGLCLVLAPVALLQSCTTEDPLPKVAEALPRAVRAVPARVVETVTPEQACINRLRKKGAVFERVPDLVDQANGCGYRNAVELASVGGMEFTRPLILQCPLAERVTDWLKESVQPAAKELLDSEITKVVTFQGFSCRNARGRTWGGQAFRLSQHAYGNAIDIAGFHLVTNGGPDGATAAPETVSVQRDWRVDGPRRTLLHRIATAGCDRFSKTLTPDYDWYHRHHLHLDLAEDRLCGYGDRFRRPPPPVRPPQKGPVKKAPVKKGPGRPIAAKLRTAREAKLRTAREAKPRPTGAAKPAVAPQ